MTTGGRGRSGWLARRQFESLRYLGGNLLAGVSAVLVLAAALLALALTPVGLGVLLAGVAAFWVRRWCEHDRARTARYLARRVGSPYHQPASMRPSAIREHARGGTLRRDLGALLLRVVVGVPTGLVAILLPLVSLNAALLSLYWWALPTGTAAAVFPVDSWWAAVGTALAGVVGLALWLAMPAVAVWDARAAARTLSPSPEQELRQRVEAERRRRRSAESAHTAELARIERDLHDAAQNRLVAVSMFVGMARRQLTTGRSDPVPALVKAQAAATDALAEVRRIIHGIHPPVLTDEGLLPALGLLADRAHVPTRLHVDRAAPTPAAVDAALYFAIAEALTNVAKHSRATACDIHLSWSGDGDDRWVTAEIVDDGRGGADATVGGGLAGIERRIDALGGWFRVVSPPGGPTRLRMGLPCEF